MELEKELKKIISESQDSKNGIYEKAVQLLNDFYLVEKREKVIRDKIKNFLSDVNESNDDLDDNDPLTEKAPQKKRTQKNKETKNNETNQV